MTLVVCVRTVPLALVGGYFVILFKNILFYLIQARTLMHDDRMTDNRCNS